ncbi:unnamed protein product [Calypogeia fissa]
MASVERKDVKDWAKEQGVERGREEDPSSVLSGNSASQSSEGDARVQEGNNTRSSYDRKEDVSPSFFQKLKGTFLGAEDTKEQLKNAETVSSKDVAEGLKKPVGKSVQSDEKRGQLGSDELGTGYEEDTEKGALSSESSADWSDNGAASSQPQSLFKPVKEKDPSDLTLEDLRATKAKKVSSPDEVKAPGILGRAYEEVEAVGEAAMEGLNFKGKQAKSGD